MCISFRHSLVTAVLGLSMGSSRVGSFGASLAGGCTKSGCSLEKLDGMAGRSGTAFFSSISIAGGVGGISVSNGRAFRGRLRLRPILLNFFSALAVVGRLSRSSPVEPGRFLPNRTPEDVVGRPLSSHGVSHCGVISFTFGPAMVDQNETKPIAATVSMPVS